MIKQKNTLSTKDQGIIIYYFHTILKYIIQILFLAFQCNVAIAQNTLNHEGENYFINGINMPWNHFGVDIGNHDDWGNLFEIDYYESFFKDCQTQGVNCARWWIHCDGRASPEFDIDGNVIGLDDNFLAQFNHVNELAKSYGVMLMPCLWSFDMLKDYTSGAGVWAGLHHDLIEEEAKTKSYIDNALIPFIQGIEQPCNILAIDIINEPEWGMKGSKGAGVQTPVSKENMQRFVGTIAAAIHEHSDIKTTLGSTSLNFVSAINPAKKPLWTDDELQSTIANNQAHLDFYQIHFYDWMFWKGWNPFLLNYEYWQLDKPCIIGEYPAADGIYKAEDMIQLSLEKGWSGHMPWSHSANDGHGEWANVSDALLLLSGQHSEIINHRTCELVTNTPVIIPTPDTIDNILIAPNPIQNILNIEYSLHVTDTVVNIEVFDLFGRNIFSSTIKTINSTNKLSIDLSHLANGTYYLKVNEELKPFAKLRF